MFLTRSIRRKLGSVFAGVALMLVVLAGSGVWGLLSFRELLDDSQVDEREEGSAADVVAAVARLRNALPHSTDSAMRGFDPGAFQQQQVQVQTATAAYRARIRHLPQAVQQQVQHVLASQLLGDLDRGLRELNPTDMRANARLIAHLEDLAIGLPESPDRLQQRLWSARQTYSSSLLLLGAGTAVAVVLLVWLFVFGYRHVFQPIHELHQGARRVAQGDFEYRVAIPADDEVGELAEAFNLMAERFQEIATDLDGQVKARSQQLVRSERLASVGFLAAGVAHEINNPLTAIRWTSESLESRLAELLRDAPDDDASIVLRYVRMIQSESDRCQEITRKLLDFSRNHDSERSPHDMASLVREVVTLIGHMQKYRSGKLLFDHADPCVIEINGHEIKQVVLNLVANALDATDGSGTVEVSLSENVDSVELRFSDNGCGMTQETIDNLFQPFFTTKPTGQGTGLGLSISHRIVTDHGGHIEVHSDGEGLGSSFIVRLPRRPTTHGCSTANTPLPLSIGRELPKSTGGCESPESSGRRSVSGD